MDPRHRAANILDGLRGQTIHKVDIDLFDANIAQKVDGPLHHVKRLNSSDRALHVIGKILDAEACPGYANIGKRLGECCGDEARIKFDRMLPQRCKIEPSIKLRRKLAQKIWSEN
jgi:hypothetical protein